MKEVTESAAIGERPEGTAKSRFEADVGLRRLGAVSFSEIH
jgi:hypothetical protein